MSATSPFIPESAPFSTDQRAWLNGFLAGLFSSQEGAVGTAPVAATPVTVLFGSQTGTAEALAKKAAKQLKASQCDPKVVDMGEVSAAELASIENLLLITSTYGEGDPPDNAIALHGELMADGAPGLSGVRYAVLGLGDSSYPDFCQCSKEFDARLEALGAQRMAKTVEVDGDPDALFPQWLEAVQGVLGQAGANPPPFEDAPSEAEPEFHKKNPFPAKLLKTENLNKAGSAKATHHIELSLEASGLTYEAGDALGVYPENNVKLVDEIIAAAGFTPDEPAPVPHGPDLPLFDALRHHYDISVLTEPFLLACARLTKNPRLREIVADEAHRKAYLAGRGLVDPIVDYDVKFPTTEYLVAPLKALNPRLYSISSSPKAHPGEVHLTVGKVTYDAHGRQRLGVCSNYLAEHDGHRPVKVYVHANQAFRPPANPDAPMIMVGPGTGIAPFRAFLEEREAIGAKGPNWLLFGDQRASTDFLYAEQIDHWLKSGLLTRLDTAFSRDQEEKIYVQQRLLENAPLLIEWLDLGGSFYVCGDASRMAKDVEAALLHAIAEVKSIEPEAAADYLATLKREKRYLRDVY